MIESVERESSPVPFISVIIPCHNEERWIGATLNALQNQTYPSDRYEIIVVDNNSSDQTREIARRFPVQLLVEPKRSSYRARDLGIRHARGELMAFIDADCIPSPEWLEHLVKTALTQNCSFVAGQIENQVIRRNFANLLLSQRRTEDSRRRSIEIDQSVPGGNMLIAAELFQKYGLFRMAVSGADNEFSRRVATRGERIAYAEQATVVHQCDLSNVDFLKRSFRIQYGQHLMIAADSNVGRLFKRFLALPWRPGLMAFQTLEPEFRPTSTPRHLGLWLYMWADRWAVYAGSVAGAFMACFPATTSESEEGAPL